MRGASVLIALAGIAFFSLGFIKLAQNTFVQPPSVQYGSKLSRHSGPLGAGEDLDFSKTVGAKAILLTYATSALTISVDQRIVDKVMGQTVFGTRKDTSRKLSFPQENAEKAIKTVYKMFTSPIIPTEEELESVWQKVKECRNGGVVIHADSTLQDFNREDGFQFGLSIMAVDCKPTGPKNSIELASFQRGKGGEYRKQEISKTLRYYQEGTFVDTQVTVPRSLRVPAVVNDEMKRAVELVSKNQLIKDLTDFARN